MKVLHIIDSLGLGGAQTVVKGIFEKQMGNKNIFLYALRKREITIEINHKKIIIHNSDKKYSLAPIKELKDIIEKEKIEVLHCHLFRAQFFGWLLKKSNPNVKLIMHEHGQIFQNDFYYNKFMNIAQKQTDLFLAVSKATKQKLIDKAKINPRKIKVLYNFVDLDKFNIKNIKIDVNKEKEKLGIKKEEFVIGFAGRLIKRKGWKEFIEVVRVLNKKENNFKFLIAGEGADKKKMINLIKRYKLNDKIIYLGYTKDMLIFYGMLDCFVIPSHWEPMGLTELEAQACKCPIIVSDVDGLNEVVKDKKDCFLFESKNVNDLSKKVNIIYWNKKLRKKIIRGGLRNVMDYSLISYLKELNEIYGRLK